jgi:hypothetical protein
LFRLKKLFFVRASHAVERVSVHGFTRVVAERSRTLSTSAWCREEHASTASRVGRSRARGRVDGLEQARWIAERGEQ